jgi:CheY-like chemotaxis protein
MIKDRVGLERIMAALTRKRLYNCCDCNLKFRMPDRRRIKRAPGEPATPSAIASRSEGDSSQLAAGHTDDGELVEGKRPAHDQKTILVVDDQADVLNSLSALLVAHSHRVLTAGSGAGALQQSRDYPDDIHLLLSEIQMPVMSGLELARELSLQRPEMKVLLMSSAFPSGMQFSHGWRFLPKPISPSHLPALIFDLIGAGAGPHPETHIPGTLSAIKTICPDRFSGDQFMAAQGRDLAISSIFALNRFVITENSRKADAFLRGSVAESAVSAHSRVLAASGAGGRDAGASQSQSPAIQWLVSVSLSLVNREGDMIWAVSQDSSGGRMRSALFDAVDRGVQQLANCVEEDDPG